MSHQYQVRIENTKGTRTKYEYDKETETLRLDRMIHTSSAYLFDYGYIEGTHGGDGDPLDAIVLCSEPLIPNCVVWCRPIGMLDTEDEKGRDEKLIMVPITKVDPEYADVESINDKFIRSKKSFIKHFFERYKENEPGKECIVKDFHEADEAVRVIEQGIKDYEEKLERESPTKSLEEMIEEMVNKKLEQRIDSIVASIVEKVLDKLK